MRTILVATLGLLPAALAAQTNDRFYRSWSWAAEAATARAAGLGGAVVALADDASAPLLNPAAILTLPRSELMLSLRRAQPGSTGLDATASGSALGFVGGAGLLSSKWGIGGYVSRPHLLDLALDERALPDGSKDAGYLRTLVTDAGGALAWNPAGRLFLGLRVTATHLELEGAHSETTADGVTRLSVGTSAGSTRLTGSLGVLYQVTDAARLGLLVTPGASWKADRTAANPALGVVLDAGSEYELRSPGLVAAGASLRLSDRVRASAQLDFVRYSEIRSTLVIRRGAFDREDYELADAFEPRLGLEASFPLSGVSLQARAGVHGGAAGSLAYRREDQTEAAAFRGGERGWRLALGSSVVTRSLRLDLALVTGHGPSRALAGASLRF